MKSILVAYDSNYGIGANNDLLWLRDLPADLSRFKQLTMNGCIIMGRKTYESIGRPLPGRQNIVLSHSPSSMPPEAAVARDLEEAFAAADPGREIFVIGGGQVYEQAITIVDRIYATEVKAAFSAAEVYFPSIDKAVWREIERVHHAADDKNKWAFDFVTYARR